MSDFLFRKVEWTVIPYRVNNCKERGVASESVFFIVWQTKLQLTKLGIFLEVIVEELTGKCMTSTPSRTTVGRIAREMDVISDIQVGKSTKLQWSDL